MIHYPNQNCFADDRRPRADDGFGLLPSNLASPYYGLTQPEAT
jgi:hypothetical protein